MLAFIDHWLLIIGYPRIKRGGYTLIEILVVVTLVVMLIGISVGAYRKTQNNQSIKTSSETLLSALSAAQKQASSGTSDCSGTYLGQQVRITSGSTSFTTRAQCRDSALNYGTTATFSLESNTFQTTNTLIFRPLSQGVDTGASTSQNIDFTTPLGGTYRTRVTSSGSLIYLGKM